MHQYDILTCLLMDQSLSLEDLKKRFERDIEEPVTDVWFITAMERLVRYELVTETTHPEKSTATASGRAFRLTADGSYTLKTRFQTPV